MNETKKLLEDILKIKAEKSQMSTIVHLRDVMLKMGGLQKIDNTKKIQWNLDIVQLAGLINYLEDNGIIVSPAMNEAVVRTFRTSTGDFAVGTFETSRGRMRDIKPGDTAQKNLRQHAQEITTLKVR